MEKPYKKCSLLFLLLLISIIIVPYIVRAYEDHSRATDIFFRGNDLYGQGRYKDAILAYEEILSMGVSSGNLYYNLGNAYFKEGELGKALLNYERAMRLIPRDADLRMNIRLIDNKYFEERRSPFFSIDEIAIIGGFFFLLLSIAGILHVVFPRTQKRLKWPIRIITILFFIALGIFAFKFYNEETLCKGIIIACEGAIARYEPSIYGVKAFELREGEKVVILEEYSGWMKVKKIDGLLGWVEGDDLERL